MTDEAIQALEALVIDNPPLDQLETLIGEFNIFEAMGAVRQELRHSDFLAFLLDPNGKHGLDDIFLKRFLIRVLSEAGEPPVSPIMINVTRLSNAVVERESQHIDILIHDADSKLVCLIENKVFSDEHSNQLNRYLESVRRRFPEATVIPVFLTPDGNPPADEDSPYIPFSYGDVADILDQMRQAQASVLGMDVNTMIAHYVTMLRRYIVTDSDVAELCRQIYQAHKAAIDLIIEHMPDQQLEMANHLAGLVQATPDLTVVRHIKSYVDFVPQAWLSVPEMNTGYGLNPHSPVVVSFQFYNGKDRMTMYMSLGPVRPENEYIREALYNHAKNSPDLFKGCRPSLSARWTILYKYPLLRASDFRDATTEDVMAVLEPKWRRFANHIMPELIESISEIEFKKP